MTSAIVTKKLREEATCAICLDLMTTPVSIDCGHNFCRECIVGLLGNQSSKTPALQRFHCPQCREPFKSDSLRPNKQLENIIETIKETDQEMLCNEHGENLHLFCEDDGQLICWRCERTSQHRGHVTTLVEEACGSYKKQLQKAVTKLKNTEVNYRKLKLDTTKKISNWKEIIKCEKERIHSEFMNLHKFLHQEEESYMCRLEREKEQKLNTLQDNVVRLENKLQELKKHILELDKKCQGSAHDLLQDIKGTLSRSSAINLEKPKDVSLEVETVCNVSELNFSVIKLLKHYFVNVTLDPDTASPGLRLYDNQRSVRFLGESSHVTLNTSETFNRVRSLACVLGRERFTSGRHYFEVDVQQGFGCVVGLRLENASWGITEYQSGLWAIKQCSVKNYLALTSPPTPLPLKNEPKVVGIILDCDAGTVSFYNATTGSHIYTFPKASFSRALRPYFQLCPFTFLSLISSDQ